MDSITICTRAYMQELIDFYYIDVKEHVLEEGMVGGEFFFTLPRQVVDAAQLSEVMEDILLEKNPIVSSQAKVFDTLKTKVFGQVQVRQQMALALAEHLQTQSQLNVDGYIQFRLGRYEAMISEILYSAVKKNLKVTPVKA